MKGLWCRRLCAALAVAVCIVDTVCAQSMLTAPDFPIGIAGHVHVIARQPDGGMIVGGEFALMDGVPRNNLARLHPDGTLDQNWNPSPDAAVDAVVVDAAGRVYIGGLFNNVDGLPRNHIARIAGTGRGAVDAQWDPGRELSIRANALDGSIDLALGARGDVFVSGILSSAQLGRRDIIRIAGSTNGIIDPVWNPPAGSGGRILSDTTRAVLYAGDYYHPLRKISQTGRGDLVADWQPGLDKTDALALGPDGALYLGSNDGFSDGNGGQCHLARIAADSHGEFDHRWNPPCEWEPTAFAFDGDAVYVSFEKYYPYASGIARLSVHTGTTVWLEQGEGARALAVGAGDSLYVGGHFVSESERPSMLKPKMSLARLNATDGRLLAAADAALPGTVNVIAPQSDGALIVGGRFDVAGTTPRTNLLRLTADGRLDAAWNPAPKLHDISAIAIDADDDVYAGGLDPEPTLSPLGYSSSVFKFDGDGMGRVDPSWNLPLIGEVAALASDERGGLYVGGSFVYSNPDFDHWGYSLAKVSLRDASPVPFTDPPVSEVHAILVDADDNAVYVAGPSLPEVLSGNIFNVAKLSNATGALRKGWTGMPQTRMGMRYSTIVHALARSRDGSIYAAGFFPGAADEFSEVFKFTRDLVPDAQWNATAVRHDANYHEAIALALDDHGNVYLGGQQGEVLATAFIARPYAQMRSGSTGAPIDTWAPVFDSMPLFGEPFDRGRVNALTFSANGTIHVGGNFTIAGDEPRSGLAAFSPGPVQIPARDASPRTWPGPPPPRPQPSSERLRTADAPNARAPAQ